MNTLYNLLTTNPDFVRTNLEFSLPIVVHGVPGCGKSTLLREFADLHPEVDIFTCGEPVEGNLAHRGIRKFETVVPNSILDEYQLFEGSKEDLLACFGDPLQGTKGVQLPAHFVNYKSKRFGKNTAALLNSFGYRVEAEGEDNLVRAGLFKGTIRGQVICSEPEIFDLLNRHYCPFSCIHEVQGRTFEEVTLVSNKLSKINRVELFIALSRHRRSLTILANEFDPAS